MSTLERRMAARANQRAAAFVRFQMTGDVEGMQVILAEAAENERAQLSFVTALASIASSVSITAFGRERALEYLQSVATSSAVLSESDDIDSWFD